MPQFLERRDDTRVEFVMSIFWLGLSTFVNLAAVVVEILVLFYTIYW
ncbi:MAG: hypothetical protein OEM85_00065 [Gammaproteobacteria bacterium]|nr:hypothetical protein [Gammaproteobacteria bacterium]